MTQNERVREIRNSLKLTLEKFGEKLGVTKVAISNIEKGNRSLTEQMARAICREYNVNYDYLMDGEGEMFDDLPQTILDELCRQYNLDDFDKELLQIYIEKSEEDRRYLKSEICNMINKVGRFAKKYESGEE